jgi:hypothetical protein
MTRDLRGGGGGACAHMCFHVGGQQLEAFLGHLQICAGMCFERPKIIGRNVGYC